MHAMHMRQRSPLLMIADCCSGRSTSAFTFQWQLATTERRAVIAVTPEHINDLGAWEMLQQGGGTHLILLVGLALFIAYAKLIRRLSLLHDHHLETSACQPLSIVVVILFWEATVRLFTLQHNDPRA